MGLGGRISFRLAVVVATLASVLVPAWIAPAEGGRRVALEGLREGLLRTFEPVAAFL